MVDDAEMWIPSKRGIYKDPQPTARVWHPRHLDMHLLEVGVGVERWKGVEKWKGVERQRLSRHTRRPLRRSWE